MKKINKFNILSIVCILMISFSISPITLQNDTFYTIKIGEVISQSGIDMLDPFSIHEDLDYTYPHWAYDVAIYQIYNLGEMAGIGGYEAIYISTIIFTFIMGVLLFYISKKLNKNDFIALVMTLVTIYLMRSFIAARAQLITYIIFLMQIYFIEMYLKNGNKKYGIGLIILPIIIANVHLAVWPFYFVLFLPYIAEYIIMVVLDSNFIPKTIINLNKLKIEKLSRKNNNKEKLEVLTLKIEKIQTKMEENIIKTEKNRENPYKLKVEKNKFIKGLIIVALICSLTGLCTPLGFTPYTYLYNTMQGNTMDSISEHLPLTLINYPEIIVTIVLFLAMIMFTNTKIRMSDLFMLSGLLLLMFMSRRQISMFLLITTFIFQRLVVILINKFEQKEMDELMVAMNKKMGIILTLFVVLFFSYMFYKPKMGNEFVNTAIYPVEASEFILKNLDIENLKMYNEYNYGSYLLYKDIPVFIDSRADLYAPEFNGKLNKDGEYEERDIFGDYLKISTLSASIYFEDLFEKYDFNYAMVKDNSKLNMLLSRDEKYLEIYSDDYFIIYEIIK